jgi:colicin import membrane protein
MADIPVLTAEEIALLKGDPKTAEVAKKLEAEVWLPKKRFDEVNQAKKDAEAAKVEAEKKLTEAQAAQKTREEEEAKKKGDWEALAKAEKEKSEKMAQELATEKKLGDAFRQMREEKMKAAKEEMGEAWDEAYENLSVSAVEKLVAIYLKSQGKQTKKPDTSREQKVEGLEKLKNLDNLTPAEFQKLQDEAIRGEHAG